MATICTQRKTVLSFCVAFVTCLDLSTAFAGTKHEAGLPNQTVATASEPCTQVGSWFDPDTKRVLEPAALFASLAKRSVVLLGERHDQAEHHRWQLHTLAGLYVYNPSMVIGFEMFPRFVQSALDRWIAGELDESAFLKAARWDEVWGYEAKFYTPLFHFARQNRIPMVALNVERSLISDIRDKGWDAIPVNRREGVTTPAPISDGYRRALAAVYLIKLQMSDGDDSAELGEWSEERIQETLDDEEFQRFVQAQSTWDRAMAQGLTQARQETGAALAVGVMGSGHVEFGYGVAHQLADLGVNEVATTFALESTDDCASIEPGVADAVFVVDTLSIPQVQRQLLGVMIEGSDQGVRVTHVTEASVAEAAGIEAGDTITQAAGQAINKTTELIAIVKRHAPGTWLPLTVQRGDQSMQIVAKFAPLAESGE
ncbi:MAG: ChaN family lipoprotein [Gammaproteobacteria bacterium]|nr:ChaN family lipoprotein [Gammaproteobacteria bacterium]